MEQFKPINYKDILEHSFTKEKNDESHQLSRLEYLSQYIFDFTTYDSAMDELFARKAVEVCSAIVDGKTFEYIKTKKNYEWFLVMCNMKFFSDNIEWGTSVRGAWWGTIYGNDIEFQSCGLWIGDKQITDVLHFSNDEWKYFICKIIEFADPEIILDEKSI